jgi:hypothetical protein
LALDTFAQFFYSRDRVFNVSEHKKLRISDFVLMLLPLTCFQPYQNETLSPCNSGYFIFLSAWTCRRRIFISIWLELTLWMHSSVLRVRSPLNSLRNVDSHLRTIYPERYLSCSIPAPNYRLVTEKRQLYPPQ